MQSPDSMELSREQVLVAMGVTALVLGTVGRIWMWLGNVELLPFFWNGPQILVGIGLGFAIVGISRLMYWLWPGYRACARLYMETIVKPLAWPDLMWLGLLPSFSEEFLFRGVAMGAFGITPTVVVVTSIAFGVLHLMDLQQWPYGVWAIAIGAVFGTSVLFTGNLLVPCVAHLVANILSGSLWKYHLQHQT